jgi:hypothetical protein
MKNIHLFIYLALISLLSCNEFSELMFEPEIGTISEAEAELINSFSGLTNDDASACNIVRETGEIPDILCRIVAEARRGSEIVFLVDRTASMGDDIDEVKRNINDIINCLPDGVRLGAATYGDNRADGDNWFTSIDLSEDYSVVRTFINAITVVGGGDDPESVFDGIYRVLDEMSWKDCVAPDKIIVMGDAPPHTGTLTDYSVEDVLQKAESICPDTEFYPVIVLEL